MALILADTDVLIDYLAGVEPIRGRLAQLLSLESLDTSSISCFELLIGAREGQRGDAVRRLLAMLPVSPVDRQAAENAASPPKA